MTKIKTEFSNTKNTVEYYWWVNHYSEQKYLFGYTYICQYNISRKTEFDFGQSNCLVKCWRKSGAGVGGEQTGARAAGWRGFVWWIDPTPKTMPDKTRDNIYLWVYSITEGLYLRRIPHWPMYESSSIDEIKPRTNIVPALAAVSDVNILAPDRHQ